MFIFMQEEDGTDSLGCQVTVAVTPEQWDKPW